MIKLEKVIHAFENCTDPAMNDDDDETFCDCIRAGVCPWDDCQERGRKMIDVPLSLAMAALELLKAQEPAHVQYRKMNIGKWALTVCGNCKEQLREDWKFCPICGKAVKWND